MSPSFLKRNERKLFFLAFITGFVFDWLTVRYLDLKEAGMVLGLYLLAIAVSIIIQNRIRSKVSPGFIADKLARFIPYLIQFMFGTLFNAAFIFYSGSAELYSSWPFILFIVAVVFVNEIFRDRHNSLAFQIVMLFTASFLYFVFATPILLGKISTGVFLLSGGASLVFLFLVMFFLARWARERFLHRHKILVAVIICLFGLFNLAYFTNVIPPIPLALKSADVYHSVQKVGNTYEVQYELSVSNFWRKGSKIFHASPGEVVYVFTSVFAPTAKISAQIYHEWWHFDAGSDKWVLVNKSQFPIIGGRKEGYRGYSFKQDISSGKWRVYIATEDGKRLGHISFKVEKVSVKPRLVSKTI